MENPPHGSPRLDLVSEFSDASTATYTAGTTPQQAPSDTVSTLLYQHQDHLTTCLATDNYGNVAYQRGNYPYGDMWYETGAAAYSVQRKYTRYMLESELPSSALHASLYRQHSARIGRFQIPDRARGNIFSPQRLNRYSYVRNDPVNRTDPKGLDDDGPPDPTMWEMDVDGGGGGGGGGSGDVGGSGDSGGSLCDPFDPICGPGTGDICDPTVEYCGDPPIYCDPSVDPTCGVNCDPMDPSCSGPCDPANWLCGQSLCAADDPGCLGLGFALWVGTRDECRRRCLTIYLGELLLCNFMPPPGDILCASVAAIAYYGCLYNCGRQFP